MKNSASLREQLASLTNQLAPLRARYEALQPREQLFVGAAGVVIVLALIYSAVWAPFAHARVRHARELEDARGIARSLAIAEAQVRVSNPAEALVVDRSMSLEATIELASKNGTLPKPLTSQRTEANNQVRVLVEGVPFDAATKWIYELQTRYGIHIDGVDIERQDTPGVVTLRLSVSRAS